MQNLRSVLVRGTAGTSVSTGLPRYVQVASIYGSSYYTIVDGPTWKQAQANSESIGGYLVSINTQAEEDFLHKNFSKNQSGPKLN